MFSPLMTTAAIQMHLQSYKKLLSLTTPVDPPAPTDPPPVTGTLDFTTGDALPFAV